MKSNLKNIRDRIRTEITPNGVSIWLDGKWIIDASTILLEGIFAIAPNCKSFKDGDSPNKCFVIRKRKDQIK